MRACVLHDVRRLEVRTCRCLDPGHMMCSFVWRPSAYVAPRRTGTFEVAKEIVVSKTNKVLVPRVTIREIRPGD